MHYGLLVIVGKVIIIEIGLRTNAILYKVKLKLKLNFVAFGNDFVTLIYKNLDMSRNVQATSSITSTLRVINTFLFIVCLIML